MNSNIILTAETGSDVSAALAAKLGVYLVNMHVNMGDQTLDDSAFPPEEVCAYYDRTGKVPTTSAAAPYDFEKVFDEIHAAHPDKHIVHLAYSAVTTCSYQNGVLVSEDRPYVTCIDTKQVSVGQAAVVIESAKFLEANPDADVEELCDFVLELRDRVKMCFIPKNLDYLRAGGRVSNAVAIAGNLLALHPCIEILDGYLMARKKYRGAMDKIVPKLVEEYVERNNLDREMLYFINTPYMDDGVRSAAEQTAEKLGFKKVEWMKTGCVITCHGGPGAFGIVGFSAK